MSREPPSKDHRSRDRERPEISKLRGEFETKMAIGSGFFFLKNAIRNFINRITRARRRTLREIAPTPTERETKTHIADDASRTSRVHPVFTTRSVLPLSGFLISFSREKSDRRKRIRPMNGNRAKNYY